MPTENAYSSGHLVLSQFGACKCSYVETVLMLRPISPELVLFPVFWVSNIPRYFCFGFILYSLGVVCQQRILTTPDTWSYFLTFKFQTSLVLLACLWLFITTCTIYPYIQYDSQYDRFIQNQCIFRICFLNRIRIDTLGMETWHQSMTLILHFALLPNNERFSYSFLRVLYTNRDTSLSPLGIYACTIVDLYIGSIVETTEILYRPTPDQLLTFSNRLELITQLDIITDNKFHGVSATVVSCSYGTFTPPGTWSRPF